MSTATLMRPVTTGAPTDRPHVHDRSCFWDVLECRWSGPAHRPPRRTATVPAPR